MLHTYVGDGEGAAGLGANFQYTHGNLSSSGSQISVFGILSRHMTRRPSLLLTHLPAK